MCGVGIAASELLFTVFYGFELGMREATGLRERQRASVEVERPVEAQLGLREWSARESEGETRLS